MKNFSNDLVALLARNAAVWPGVNFDSLYQVDLFTITCVNGVRLRTTSGQVPVTWLNSIYEPGRFGYWSRGALSTKVGTEAATMQLMVMADQTMNFPGLGPIAILDAIVAGLFDQALVSVDRLYSPLYGQTHGPNGGALNEIKFVGHISAADKVGQTRGELTVSDLRYLLNHSVPAAIMQSGCRWQLFDTGCGLNRGLFTAGGTVASSAGSSFLATGHVPPLSAAGTWKQGTCSFSSGQNSGLSYAIADWTNDIFTLDVQPIFPIVAGDQFAVSQGCNRQYASCIDLQGPANAVLRYGGAPTVPVPETAV